MATLARKFGTFALGDANGINGINATKISARVLVASEFEPRPQGHGSLFKSQRYEGQEVSLAGGLQGATNDEARARLGALIAALCNGEQYLTTHDDRRILCRLSKDVDWDAVEGLPMAGFSWSAVFRSRWPTWEKVALTTDTFNWTTAPTQIQVLSANTGDAEAWPRIVLTENGPGFVGAQIVLVNTSTDMQLSLQGVGMNTGQALSIDMREGRLHDGLGAEMTVLGIEGSWFPIGPGGAQALELQTNLASPNFGVVVDRHDQFWAP